MRPFATKVFQDDSLLLQVTCMPNSSLLVGMQMHRYKAGFGMILSAREASVMERAILCRTPNQISRPDGRELKITPATRINPYREGVEISLQSYSIFLDTDDVPGLVTMIQDNLQIPCF